MKFQISKNQEYFIRMENTYYNETYLQYIFANCAAPVAVDRKPACLITIWKYRIKDIDFASYISKEAAALFQGSSYEIITETPLYYQLFCYKEKTLKNELDRARGSQILSDYPVHSDIRSCISILKEKMCNYNHLRTGFPHEIGIFLGYPIWDVEGFITNKGQNYKLCGYWKVYEDIPGALARFQEYDKLKNDAIRIFKQRIERNNRKN